MPSQYHGEERRQSIRAPLERRVHFRTLSFFEHKIISASFLTAISNNLSTTGLSFISQEHPSLSSIILINLNGEGPPFYDSIKQNVLTLDGKLLGKVVRIEETADGKYNVGVVFIAEPKSGKTKTERLVKYFSLLRKWTFLFQVPLIMLLIYLTLSFNIVYLEKKETYHPSKIMYTNPETLGIFYEDIDLKTKDGETLNAWFIPAKNAKITILYCQGTSGNMSDELSKIKFFNAMNFNLMIFDYRGYGNSSGKPSEQGFYNDALAAYDYLISRTDIDKDRIVVFGESLGGAVATELCLNRKAKGLVLESSIVSIAIKTKERYFYLPVDKLLFEKFDTLSKIKNVYIPKLIVHGLDDETVPFNDAIKLFYAAPAPKEFLPFQGLHDDEIFKVSDTYKNELIKFFRDNNIS